MVFRFQNVPLLEEVLYTGTQLDVYCRTLVELVKTIKLIKLQNTNSCKCQKSNRMHWRSTHSTCLGVHSDKFWDFDNETFLSICHVRSFSLRFVKIKPGPWNITKVLIFFTTTLSLWKYMYVLKRISASLIILDLHWYFTIIFYVGAQAISWWPRGHHRESDPGDHFCFVTCLSAASDHKQSRSVWAGSFQWPRLTQKSTLDIHYKIGIAEYMFLKIFNITLCSINIRIIQLLQVFSFESYNIFMIRDENRQDTATRFLDIIWQGNGVNGWRRRQWCQMFVDNKLFPHR